MNGVAFSPNGRYLATCSIDTYVNIWDIDAGYIVHKMRGKVTRKLSCISFGKVDFIPFGSFRGYDSMLQPLVDLHVRVNILLFTMVKNTSLRK